MTGFKFGSKALVCLVTAILVLLAIDVSMASANDASSANESSNQIVTSKRLLEVIQSGGPLMIPIGLCSFILVVFAFERTIALRKGRVIPGVFARKFLEQIREGQLDRESAMVKCENQKSALSGVFRAGVQKWGRPSVEVEQAVLDAGERTATDLRKYLRLINGIATICPLLGLLGTVIGMIHAFDAIASVDPSQADPKVMIATGISQALLTTAAGMTVAIPALISYLYFSSRVDKRVIEIDALGQQLVELISAENIVEKTPPKKTSGRSTSKKAA